MGGLRRQYSLNTILVSFQVKSQWSAAFGTFHFAEKRFCIASRVLGLMALEEGGPVYVSIDSREKRTRSDSFGRRLANLFLTPLALRLTDTRDP